MYNSFKTWKIVLQKMLFSPSISSAVEILKWLNILTNWSLKLKYKSTLNSRFLAISFYTDSFILITHSPFFLKFVYPLPPTFCLVSTTVTGILKTILFIVMHKQDNNLFAIDHLSLYPNWIIYLLQVLLWTFLHHAVKSLQSNIFF